MILNDHNPIAHFQKWFHEVDKACPEDETNIMLLSTIGLDGYPKSRVVLLKRFTWEGFVFFTNYNSEKGKAIATNHNVSLHFNWSNAKRNVLILGKAHKIASNLSDGYFDSRPQGSKIATWASYQSDIILSREILDTRFRYYQNLFTNQDIPRPEYWGGYIIKPNAIEFKEYTTAKEYSDITLYTLNADYSWSKHRKYDHNH